VSGTLVAQEISGTQDTDEPTYLPSCQPRLEPDGCLVKQVFPSWSMDLLMVGRPPNTIDDL
jgi:hypothetical protein